MSDERVFAEGIFFKQKPQAPEWVVGQISFKVDDAIKFLKENQNDSGYVNCDIKKSKGEGKPYVELDTWQPSKPDVSEAREQVPAEPDPNVDEEDDLPF